MVKPIINIDKEVADNLSHTLPATLYPPKSNGDLQKLYKAIEECDLDILRKHSLVYYLLLDWKNASQARYARRYLIPSQFQKLMDGYWAMDHGQYEVNITKHKLGLVETCVNPCC
jgi:hypothetical protein